MVQTNSSERNRWLLITTVITLGLISLVQAGCSCGSSSSVTPSAITDVFPPQSSDGALVSTLVTATFRDDMNDSTINTTTFTLTVGGAPVVAASVDYEATTKTATLTPAADLVSGTEYRAAISSSVENLDGNKPLASDYVWSFSISPDMSLVSKNESDIAGNLDSVNSDIDDSGRFIVFKSRANNLVTGISNAGFYQIYRKDTLTGEVVLVSTDSTGLIESDNNNDSPRISGDGRYVVFSSFAQNIAVPSINGISQVILKDMQDGTFEVISRQSSTVAGDLNSFRPDISSDGQFVVFASNATNFGTTNNVTNVFFVDMNSSSVIEQISVGALNVEADNTSTGPSVSDDGRYVVFESLASNLGINNGVFDIYARDRTNLTTTLISSNCSSCLSGSDNSNNADISDNGQFVVFQSDNANLIPSDGNIVTDVFFRDTAASTDTIRISETASGPGNNASVNPSVSSDGRYIAFESKATNLDGGSIDKFDIFVSDETVVDDIMRITMSSDNHSNNARIGSDGRYVSFDSPYSFTLDDTNNGLVDTYRAYNSTF